MGSIEEEPAEGEEAVEDESPIRTMRFGTEYLMGKVGKYALYPGGYTHNHRIDGDVVTFNLPESYFVTVDKNGQTPANAAMWAEIVDGHAYFRHLASFFKIYVSNLPASGTIKLRTPDHKLTGDFECDLSSDVPTIVTRDYPYVSDEPEVEEDEDLIEGAEDGTEVTIQFENPDGLVSGVFYIPAPLGHYLHVEVELSTYEDPTAESEFVQVKSWEGVDLERCVPKSGVFSVSSAHDELQSQLDNYKAVQLQTGVNLRGPLTITKPVTLDLNGQTITSTVFSMANDGSIIAGDSHSFAFLIKNGGKLTIIDSSKDAEAYFEGDNGSGLVTGAAADNSYIAYVEDGGILDIESGCYKNQSNSAGNGSAIIANAGKVIINGGYFEPCFDYQSSTVYGYNLFTGTGSYEVEGGEFVGVQPSTITGFTSLGIKETIEPKYQFTEDYDYVYFIEDYATTTYKVVAKGKERETLEAALNTYNQVPLTSDFTFTEPIKVSKNVTLNLREYTLTGQIINENGALTIESGVNGKIVNPNGSTIKTVGVETPQTKATITVPSATIDGLHGGLASTSINGGTFIGGANSPAVEAHNNSTLNITAGRFEGLYGILTNGSVINVSGAEFDATNGIYVENSNVTYQNCNFNDVTDADVVLGNNNTESNINESNVKDGGDYEITPDLVNKFFTEGGSLTLTEENTTIGGSIELTEYMTLDLGGNTLELSNVAVKGYVTIINGTLMADKIDVTGSLTFTDVVYTGAYSGTMSAR